MSPRVALVTCAALPDLYEDEQRILPLLRARGVEAEAVVWDDPRADWSAFDAAFIRSTWDYFKRYRDFLAWVDRVEKATRLYNPPALVRWNSDKHYLADLEAKGVRIVPTFFAREGARVDIAAVLRERGWTSAVVKPSVSAGAHQTHRVSAESTRDAQGAVDEILGVAGLLVQPFVPEVQTEGEYSFLFFGDALSHVLLKTPAAGDFRVQPEFDATVAAVTPDEHLVAQARKALAALPVAPTYARVDGVRRGRDLYVMEVEVIEPYLYMAKVPGAVERFAGAVERAARTR
jgi:glutathione synthase/RimK-type ligase-like ATP-grasp enzyme